jgi:hypothetical protein
MNGDDRVRIQMLVMVIQMKPGIEIGHRRGTRIERSRVGLPANARASGRGGLWVGDGDTDEAGY